MYAALEPYGLIVAGGRVSGIGMAGFTLGGGEFPLRAPSVLLICCAGYNWLTNQVGLTLDTVTGYELVRPNGSIVSVTAETEPDLFFGLKVFLLPLILAGV